MSSVSNEPADAAAEAAPAHPDVLIVISHLGHGGTQRVVCNLANALAREGRRVRLLLTKLRDNNALQLDPAVEVELLTYKPPRRTFAHLAGLYRLGFWLPKLRAHIRASGAPVVVSFIRPTNVKVLLACLGMNTPKLVICERNDPRRQPLGRHWNLLSRLFYRTADVVTVNSRGAAQALAGWGIPGGVVYLPNILTAPPSQQEARLEAPTILAVGRLVPQKGYDVLIKALADAGDALAGWRISFLGEGPSEEPLKELAEKLGVADRLDWRGHVADPFPYYHGAMVFALPSRYEGMPNALLEAMSCGLTPVVSDASAGPLEVVSDGENGFVVPVESVTALSRALVRLAKDPEERRRLGAGARAIAAAYQPEVALQEWKVVLGLAARQPGEEHLPSMKQDSGELSTLSSSHRLSLFFRQLAHFATRPKVWPDLGRWLAKRVKDRIVGKDTAVEAARQAMAEGTDWCAENCISPAEALARLGLDTAILHVGERYPEEIAAAEKRVANVPFRLGGASNMDLIYTLCEALQATRAVETGVANGWSSLAILLSLAKRDGASLHSIDLPYLKYQNDPWVGVAVPEKLRPCWTLHRMADRDGLPKALAALDKIDFAHYDSDKSEAGRRFAYPLMWKALRPGGLLFSDDINDNMGFRDFCESVGQEPIIVRQDNKFQGILRKPAT